MSNLLKGIGVEAELHEVLKVEAKRLDVEVEEEDGVVEQEDGQHQHYPTSKTYFGESSDSVIDTFAQEIECHNQQHKHILRLPVITETVAMAVTSHMIAIWLEEVTGTEGKRRWSPWLI